MEQDGNIANLTRESPAMTKHPRADRCGPAGTTVRRAKGRQTKLIRTAGKRWSAAAEMRFLEHLAASANIKASAEAAGFSTVAIYNRRLKDPHFAARWAEALEVGYMRLECLAIELGTNALSGTPPLGDQVLPPASFGEVLNLLKLHRAQVRGGAPQRYDWRRQEADIEEVRAEVLRRLEVMAWGKE